MMDPVINVIRSLLWGIVWLFLQIVDLAFDLITKIVTLDIGSQRFVWNWWAGLVALLSLFLVYRISKILIKTMVDQQFREQIEPTILFFRMIPIAIVLLLMPFVVQEITKQATYATVNIGNFIGSNEEIKASTILVSAGLDGVGTVEQAETESTVMVTLNDITDINEKQAGSSDYKYFKGFSDLFLVFFLGLFAGIAMFLIAIQFAARVMSLGMKILISPLPISGLIDPNDSSFGTWVKLVLSDLITNFVMYLTLLFVLHFAGSRMVRNLGVLISAIVFIAGTNIIMRGMPELASLIGGDLSAGGSFQQLATLRMSGIGGMPRAIAGGLATGAGMATTLGAGAVYGAGRMLGASPQNIFNRAASTFNATKAASMAGATAGAFGSTGAATTTSGNVSSQGNTTSKSTAFSGGGQTIATRQNPAQSQSVDDSVADTPLSRASSGNSIPYQNFTTTIQGKSPVASAARAMQYAGHSLYTRSANRLATRKVVRQVGRAGMVIKQGAGKTVESVSHAAQAGAGVGMVSNIKAGQRDQAARKMWANYKNKSSSTSEFDNNSTEPVKPSYESTAKASTRNSNNQSNPSYERQRDSYDSSTSNQPKSTFKDLGQDTKRYGIDPSRYENDASRYESESERWTPISEDEE